MAPASTAGNETLVNDCQAILKEPSKLFLMSVLIRVRPSFSSVRRRNRNGLANSGLTCNLDHLYFVIKSVSIPGHTFPSSQPTYPSPASSNSYIFHIPSFGPLNPILVSHIVMLSSTLHFLAQFQFLWTLPHGSISYTFLKK